MRHRCVDVSDNKIINLKLCNSKPIFSSCKLLYITKIVLFCISLNCLYKLVQTANSGPKGKLKLRT